MKIAFLGKGGSGKSTLASALVRHLHSQGLRVLAIDADHNMDLSYNLGADPSIFLGNDPNFIKRYIGMSETANYKETLAEGKRKEINFSISPLDSFTAALTTEVEPNLLLMTAGPHTDIVRSGENCSHSLAAPLKVYVPLLSLKSNEAVVIDERAGTDPVATGILKGVDLAIIVAEPTVHSVRVAKQIAKELKLSGVPYSFVANKGSLEDEIFSSLPLRPMSFVPKTAQVDSFDQFATSVRSAINREAHAGNKLA